MIETINFDKLKGIIPAVVQDDRDGTVLMVGFMNREALSRTIEDRQVTFWSRTRSQLWRKGETSGNVLRLISIDADCDSDALLIRAIPSGPVCHTGGRSCFPQRAAFGILFQLEKAIGGRKEEMPEGSYTATLFREGTARISQKVGEEAVELVVAAQYDDRRRCIEESGDLLYHLLVLLAEKRIGLEEVLGELAKRAAGG